MIKIVLNLQVKVSRSLYPGWKDLKCHSSCRLPDRFSYIWYKSGQKIASQTSSTYSVYFNSVDSFSCAVEGHEDFPSPPVCVTSQSCNRVIYTDRSICASKGSSVDISCTYSSFNIIRSKFWFSPERSHQWQSPSQPEDLSEDSQFAGRVQVLESETGRSTLRVTDLTESDSAQYHFKFNTGWFEWRSSLPGTTLTVTALQVQVTRITVHQSDTEAELKCHSSCSPAARPSYVWFKNGQKVTGVETSSFKGRVYPGDIISCALKGHENYGSPPVSSPPDAPRLPSVSVSPSAEIVEGSSVTLTCSSDANPAANYTWYKENQTLIQGPEGICNFSSISSEDRGNYYCKSENQYGEINSSSLFLDVQYAPRLPSVSVSPSAEIVEDSSVNLTCSSDANPAANYTWYKESEDSPKASGQIFTITDIRAEHSGNYYCEAQNRRGRHNSTLQLIVVAATWKLPVALSTTAVILIFMLLLVFFCIRRVRSSQQQSEADERPDNRAQTEELHYGSVRFIRTQADTLHSDFSPARPHRNEEESVVYAATNFIRSSRRVRSSQQQSEADERPDNRAQQTEELHYSSVRFIRTQADTLHSDFSPARPHRNEEESVVYATTNFIRSSGRVRSSQQQSEADERPDNRAQQTEELHYGSVRFIRTQADTRHSDFSPARPHRNEESVVYATTNFIRSSRSNHQAAVEDPSALYSRVTKSH
ncbi:uncharacterized protein AB9X84_010496 [Acanthopagrus schlegelii]